MPYSQQDSQNVYDAIVWIKRINPDYASWFQNKSKKMKNDPSQVGVLLEASEQECLTHAKRILKIKTVYELEKPGQHNLSNALLRLSLYSGKETLVYEEGSEKAAAAAKMCDAVCDIMLDRQTSTQTKSDTLDALDKEDKFNCLKQERGTKNLVRNVLLGASCFLGVGLLFMAGKKLATGSFFFRTDGGAKRRHVLNASKHKSCLSVFASQQQAPKTTITPSAA